METKITADQTEKDFHENLMARSITMKLNSKGNPIKVQIPPAFGGLGGPGNHSPEELFLGAISGCFFTTFCVLSKNSRFDFKHISISTTGYLEKNEDGVQIMKKAVQTIVLTIEDEKHQEKAKRLLEKTENYCPIANSVKTEIVNEISVQIDENRR